jgi:hypothetical protein
MVPSLSWDWAEFRNRLKGLTPLDERGTRCEDLPEQCESGTETDDIMAHTQETWVDIPGESGSLTPTQSQMVESFAAGSTLKTSLDTSRSRRNRPNVPVLKSH